MNRVNALRWGEGRFGMRICTRESFAETKSAGGEHEAIPHTFLTSSMPSSKFMPFFQNLSMVLRAGDGNIHKNSSELHKRGSHKTQVQAADQHDAQAHYSTLPRHSPHLRIKYEQ